MAVWANPGARRSEITGVAGERLRVRLAAPPREGRANAELVRVLAAVFAVPRDAVTVVAGAGSRRKLVRVTGISMEQARRSLRL